MRGRSSGHQSNRTLVSEGTHVLSVASRANPYLALLKIFILAALFSTLVACNSSHSEAQSASFHVERRELTVLPASVEGVGSGEVSQEDSECATIGTRILDRACEEYVIRTLRRDNSGEWIRHEFVLHEIVGSVYGIRECGAGRYVILAEYQRGRTRVHTRGPNGEIHQVSDLDGYLMFSSTCGDTAAFFVTNQFCLDGDTESCFIRASERYYAVLTRSQDRTIRAFHVPQEVGYQGYLGAQITVVGDVVLSPLGGCGVILEGESQSYRYADGVVSEAECARLSEQVSRDPNLVGDANFPLSPGTDFELEIVEPRADVSRGGVGGEYWFFSGEFSALACVYGEAGVQSPYHCELQSYQRRRSAN